MLRINREQLAWAAGVFDGEGWACAARYNKVTGGMTATLVLGVGQSHREMLDRLRVIFGLGNVRGSTTRGKPFFTWRVHGFQNVQAVFAMLWPWLGSVKREQVARCLADARQYPTNRRRLFNSTQVKEIRRRLAAKESQASIANDFGVPRQRIHWIAAGRSYQENINVAD